MGRKPKVSYAHLMPTSAVQLGNEEGSRRALSLSIGPLLRRLSSLTGSPYARGFLLDLPYNAELIAAADRAGVLPDSVHRLL